MLKHIHFDVIRCWIQFVPRVLNILYEILRDSQNGLYYSKSVVFFSALIKGRKFVFLKVNVHRQLLV